MCIVAGWSTCSTPTPKWKYYRCSYMSFGLIGSVVAWCRIVNLLREVLLWLHIYAEIYIDDATTLERASLASETGRIIDEVWEVLFGFRLSHDKSDTGTNQKILGLIYRLWDDRIELEIPDEKRQSLVELVNNAKTRALQGPLRVKDLQKIAGTCEFMMTACRTSTIKGALWPLRGAVGDAQRRKLDLAPASETRKLIQPLTQLRKLIAEAPPTVFSLTEDGHTSVARVFTDASAGSEHSIGAVAQIDQKLITLRFQIPRNLISVLYSRRKAIIGALETLAVALTLERLGYLLRRRRALWYADSSVAIFAIWKGSSNDMIIRMIAQRIQKLVLILEVGMTLRYIPSRWSPSDPQTRADLLESWDAWLKGKQIEPTKFEIDPCSDILRDAFLEIKDRVPVLDAENGNKKRARTHNPEKSEEPKGPA